MTKKQAEKLSEAFKSKFGAQVEAEQVGPNGRFRFAVVSDEFEGKSQIQRQDLVWKVVDEVLPRASSLDISLILVYTPGDLAASPR